MQGGSWGPPPSELPRKPGPLHPSWKRCHPSPWGPSAPRPVPERQQHQLLLNQRWGPGSPAWGRGMWGVELTTWGDSVSLPAAMRSWGRARGWFTQRGTKRLAGGGQSPPRGTMLAVWGSWLWKDLSLPRLGWVFDSPPQAQECPASCSAPHPVPHVPPFAMGLPLPCRGVLTTPPHAVPCHVSSLPRWAPHPNGDTGGLVSVWLCHSRARAPATACAACCPALSPGGKQSNADSLV